MTNLATGDRPDFFLTLSDGAVEVGLITGSAGSQSVAAIRQLPRSPGAERKSAKQQTWTGGRGSARLAKDTSRFFDSSGAWTMVDGQTVLAPLFKYTTGYRNLNQNMPGTVEWVELDYTLGPQAYATAFVPSANYSASKIYFLIKKVNALGANSVRASLCANAGGSPSTVLASVTLTEADNPDYLSELHAFVFGSAVALTSGTTYWVVLETLGAGSGGAKWAVGVGGGATGKVRTGGTWGAASSAPYFRVLDDTYYQKRGKFFQYKRQMYFATEPTNGVAGKLYVNGDRGVATGAQTITTLKDTTKSWTTNEWAGCVALIYDGTNKAEARLIASNTSDTLTLSAAFDQVCVAGSGATASIYVILGSDKWTEVASTGLAAPVSDALVANGIVYLAQNTTAIRRMREYNNAGVWTREFASEAATATFLELHVDGTGTKKIYRVLNSTVTWARADTQAWGTNLTFDADKPLGDNEAFATGLTTYDDNVWIGKEDAIYKIVGDVAHQVPAPIGPGRNENNGRNLKGWNTNIYFPFLDGFERLYGQTMDDIGPNRDEGMPVSRRGKIVDFVPVINHGYAALDAGPNGYSAVMVTVAPGGSWHELWRAPDLGGSVNRLYFQSIPLLNARLWVAFGAQMGYLAMPLDTHNPINDAGSLYTHEGYFVTAWIDLDTPELDHFFDEVRCFTRNLQTGLGPPVLRRIAVDYQLDGPESEEWFPLGEIDTSPFDKLYIRQTGYRMRLRFRMSTDDVTVTPVLNAMDVRVNQMNEVKYDFILNLGLEDRMMLISGRDLLTTNPGGDPVTAIDVINQLQAWQEDATPLTLRCVIEAFDNYQVHLDPVGLVPRNYNPKETAMDGSLTLKQATDK